MIFSSLLTGSITYRKWTEERLGKLFQALPSPLELTTALRQRLAQVRQAQELHAPPKKTKSKTFLISTQAAVEKVEARLPEMVSREILTPLAAISGFAEMTADKQSGGQ